MGQVLFSARLRRVGKQARDVATALQAVTAASSEPPGCQDRKGGGGVGGEQRRGI